MNRCDHKALMVVFVLPVLVALFAPPANAIEEELFRLMVDKSRMDEKIRAKVQTRHYFESDIDRQDRKLSYFEYQGHALAQVHEGNNDEWLVHGNFRNLAFDTDARMPRAKVAFPEDIWDFDIGATYRYELSNDWMTGGTLRVGSNSDEPFHDLDEVSASFRWFMRMPSGENNAWVVYLNYDNDLPGSYGKAPIPGFNYLWIPNAKVQVFAGLPVMGLRAEPILEKMEISVFYALMRTLHANITGKPTDWMHVYAEYKWGTDMFRRAEREDYGERIQFHQKRAQAGFKFLVGKFTVDVHGGFAFDRFLYEGEGHEDRDDDRIKIEDGAFAGVSMSMKF